MLLFKLSHCAPGLESYVILLFAVPIAINYFYSLFIAYVRPEILGNAMSLHPDILCVLAGLPFLTPVLFAIVRIFLGGRYIVAFSKPTTASPAALSLALTHVPPSSTELDSTFVTALDF